MSSAALVTVLRQDVEDFLFAEAALLDTVQLEEWLTLFLPDARYLVPPLDVPNTGYQESLYLLMDDMKRLTSRVRQYLGGAMWVENPPSRTRRLISNVRILSTDEERLRVSANFAIYRVRHEVVDTHVGHYEHLLVATPEGLRFKERKAILDHETLRPFGKISIIL